MVNADCRILLVDDDKAHRSMLKAHLAGESYNLVEADDGDVAVHLVKEHHYDLILLDLKMKRMGGMEALSAIHQLKPNLPVIIITAFSSIETAVEAMKKGAFDYITKPVDADALLQTVERSLHVSRIKKSAAEQQETKTKFDLGKLVGTSRAMQELAETLALVAPSDATVLISGESG
ncbi:MAG: two-component system response regulator, partial [Desulfuromonas sp.]